MYDTIKYVYEEEKGCFSAVDSCLGLHVIDLSSLKGCIKCIFDCGRDTSMDGSCFFVVYAFLCFES